LVHGKHPITNKCLEEVSNKSWKKAVKSLANTDIDAIEILENATK